MAVYIRWLMNTNESSGGGNVASDGVSKIDDIFIIGTNNVGLEEIIYANVNLYPNPVVENVNIEAPFEVKKVEVFAVNGQLVKIEEGNDIHQVNLQNLSTGKYVVNIYNESNASISKKIIVK